MAVGGIFLLLCTYFFIVHFKVKVVNAVKGAMIMKSKSLSQKQTENSSAIRSEANDDIIFLDSQKNISLFAGRDNGRWT